MPKSGIVKYHVKLSCEIDGLVERTDIDGAIYGQTEGLLGPEMNINELQRTSKMGRMDVRLSPNSKPNTTTGTVVIPMSTDMDTCSLIAAAIESIDKVGPFDCRFKLESIDDVRAAKKKDIVKRAQEIRRRWATKTISEGESMLNDVHHAETSSKTSLYGRSKLTCGPGVEGSDWIILVEGRADVKNLLRAGYDNAVEIGGAKIDKSIKDLCDKKGHIVAFLDGDRAGGSILRGLKSLVPIDYELRADPSMEVEEMTPERIDEILKPVADEIEAGKKKKPVTESDKPLAEVAAKEFSGINGTLEAVALDSSKGEVFRIPINELAKKLPTQSGIHYLVLDGIVTQRLLDGAKGADVKFVVGHRMGNISSPDGMTVKTFGDLGIS